MKKPASELRQDLVSGTWVVIATGRAKRPHAFIREKRQKFDQPRKTCPFCHLETQEKPVLVYYRDKKKKDWSIAVIPNKYPAFTPLKELDDHRVGPFRVVNGVGFHEVVVMRDHRKQMGEFTVEEIEEVLKAYQERYLALMNQEFINYISIFHNHGREAGASISHPHSQIIAFPVIDPDIHRSLDGSRRYWLTNHQCVHCVQLEWERKNKKRIVFENKNFVVFCPFVSRTAFELRIFPKLHLPYFEKITSEQRWDLAEAFKIALGKLYYGLKDPAYNFFLHTAPCNGETHDHYHWHFEILPKTSIWAGFELGTGIEISTIEPEKAAEFLRKTKLPEQN